jgi:hypothetical protein
VLQQRQLRQQQLRQVQIIFDDTYLGAKASDPSTDNDGDPLTAGDLYYNTSSNEL